MEVDEWIYHHQDRFVGEEKTSMDMGFSSFITTIHGVSSYISMIEESFHNLGMKKEVEYTDDIVEKANAILQYYKLKKEREKVERKGRKKENRKKEGVKNG